jgi:hypothetical protein
MPITFLLQLTEENLDVQVNMFAVQLASTESNSDQQTPVVLQEVVLFYRRVADLVNNIVGNSSSIGFIPPVVGCCMQNYCSGVGRGWKPLPAT